MSKLAHSDEKTMDELDIQRAVEDGNEDLIERLTEYNKDWRTRAGSAKEVAEAIAEIERLRTLALASHERSGDPA
jgi:hypothetical protein